MYIRHALPDLFSGQPLIITGRYTSAAKGTIRLQGTRAGEPYLARDPGHVPDRFEMTPTRRILGTQEIDELNVTGLVWPQNGNMKPGSEKKSHNLVSTIV